ncbi:MAG: hypothetical protein KC561_18345 [Myxococcales bacterium]|nr:hypothetical protein [Myxococcales bacterium]
MGLFDKLKGMKNAVTGGGAKVTIEVGQGTRGQDIPVVVRAVGKANFQITSVYLLVRGMERIEIKDTDWDDGRKTTETIRKTHATFEQRFEVAGAQTIEDGGEYAWEAVFQVPDTAFPSIKGRYIEHVWQVQAGLDAKGNDPDSGWLELHVK